MERRFEQQQAVESKASREKSDALWRVYSLLLKAAANREPEPVPEAEPEIAKPEAYTQLEIPIFDARTHRAEPAI